jgi:hypothetical protein
MLSPEEILNDIAHHCLRVAKAAQNMKNSSDIVAIKEYKGDLDESVMWINTLSLLLIPEEVVAEESPTDG